MAAPIVPLLEKLWPHDGAISPTPDKESSTDRLLRVGEDFLASRTATFIRHVLAQLRNLVGFVVAGLLLLLLTLTSYPFQPRQTLLNFAWMVIIAVVGVTLLMLVQMNRDTILSFMSSTDPGKVNWTAGFVVRVLAYGALPMLSLLAAQFPELGGGILDFFQSSFGALRSGGLNGTEGAPFPDIVSARRSLFPRAPSAVAGSAVP